MLSDNRGARDSRRRSDDRALTLFQETAMQSKKLCFAVSWNYITYSKVCLQDNVPFDIKNKDIVFEEIM